MIDFKSTQDLQKLDPGDPVYPVIKDLVVNLIEAYTTPDIPYNAEDYGWIILIEEGDVDSDVWQGWTLAEIPWEGIMLRDGYFISILLCNNECGMIFVIKDAEFVKGKLRKVIQDNLDP